MVNGIFCLFFSSSIFWTFIIYNKYNIFTSQILTKMESFVKNSQKDYQNEIRMEQLTCLQSWKSPETWVTCLVMKIQNWENNEILMKIWWKKECNLEKPAINLMKMSFSMYLFLILGKVSNHLKNWKSQIFTFLSLLLNSSDFLIKL